MIVWLARHADAVSPDEAATDAARPLTEVGRRRAAQIGSWLKEWEESPELILHSPLVRARQTAEILGRELGAGIAIQEDNLLAPGLQCERLLAGLSRRAVQCALCVGHQPDVGRCLNEMIGGGRFAISPGTIACIEFPQVMMPGGGQLRWLLAPDWFA